MSQNYYEILGVSQTATPDEIKKKYKVLAKKYHPDQNKEAGSEEKFKNVSTAYAVLRDPAKRAEYDQQLRYGGSNSNGGFSGGYGGFSASDFENMFGDIFGGFTRKTEQEYEMDERVNDVLKGGKRRARKVDPMDFSSEKIFHGGAERDAFHKFYRQASHTDGFNQAQSPQFEQVPSITFELTLEECMEGTVRTIRDKNTKKETRIRIPARVTPEDVISVKSPRLDIHIKAKFRKWKFKDRDVILTISKDKFENKDKIDVETILGEKISIKKPDNLTSGTKLRIKGKGWLFPDDSRSNMYIIIS